MTDDVIAAVCERATTYPAARAWDWADEGEAVEIASRPDDWLREHG